MENHLYHPNMEGRTRGLGWHTKRPARPYHNPRSCPPTPSPLLFQASVSRLPCCREPDSAERGWRSGHNKKWKLLPRKVSEELTSDGWRTWCGGGCAGRGMGELDEEEEELGEDKEKAGSI